MTSWVFSFISYQLSVIRETREQGAGSRVRELRERSGAEGERNLQSPHPTPHTPHPTPYLLLATSHTLSSPTTNYQLPITNYH
ncbi:hypothetical protein [Chroococcidiopsis sp.]|uniref:hypothetical protein n=1 Tax=Chroococcidiopsis sp. TaxID=3088168 RepID=UPI003F402514